MAERKSLGTDLPAEVVKRFSDWSAAKKYVKAGAAAAALELLQHLPLRIRDAVMEQDWKLVDDSLRQAERYLIEQSAGTEMVVLEAKADLPTYRETRPAKKGATR